MFRSDSHGAWLSSLGADLLLLVEIDYISNQSCPLSKASKKSGLSVWVGNELGVLGDFPDWAMVVIVCILVKALVEDEELCEEECQS